jgi:hypothetical protein
MNLVIGSKQNGTTNLTSQQTLKQFPTLGDCFHMQSKFKERKKMK